MKSRSWFWFALACALITCGGPVSQAQVSRGLGRELRRELAQIDPAEHIERLAGIQSRFTGYPGCAEAEQYVLDRYRSLGLANVSREPFQIIVPVDWGASLTVGSRRITVHCVRPNYVRTPKTEETGLRGSLIWGGEGYPEDFNGRRLDGAVVLMEFNTATRWLTAANLGARAIVFLEPLHAFRLDAEQKYLTIPMPVPRYYLERRELPALAAAVTGRGAEEFDEQAALKVVRGLGLSGPDISCTVHADMVWEERPVYLVSGEVPGTDPTLGKQTLVCHAYYDSISVVPALAPGAENACGIAAQLEIAELLMKHPPRRTVKFLATPGHFQSLAGVRQYAFQTIYPRRQAVSGDAEEERAGEPFFFMGLDISSRHNSMAVFFKGHFYDQGGTDESKLQRAYSDYGRLVEDWAEEVLGPEGVVRGLEFHSGIVPRHGRGWRSLLPDRAAFDAELITLSGRPAITLATTGDPRNAVNSPLDTYGNIKPYLHNVRAQAIMSAYVVKRTADLPVIVTDKLEVGKVGSIFGRCIEQALSEYVPPVNVPDAVAGVMLAKQKSMMGVKGRAFARSDVQGLFEVFGLQIPGDLVVDGFVISPATGAVEGVAEQELVVASARKREEWDLRRTDLRLNFFDCVSTSVFGLINPLRLNLLTEGDVLRGETNSDLQYSASFFGGTVEGTSYGEPAAVFYSKEGRRLKILLRGGGLSGNDGVLLNVPVALSEKEAAFGEPGSEDTFQGIGFLADKPENFIYLTNFQMARDAHLLDYHRLRSLKQAFILKRNIWDLHEQAKNQLVTATQRLEALDYPGYARAARAALALENMVYPDVRGTVYDVLRGVIFYFALLLPFVIFGERLLTGFVDIRKKLGAIAVLFVLSYGVLMLVHPAFRLSKAPIIILDGFMMLVAALWTAWYLALKFQAVVDQFKQHVQTIHRADVARASAAMAAFVLGISNMRKRKVRTILTALTLILLTFTVLSFTSFETVPAGLLQYTSSREAPYEGVLVRSLTWAPLNEFMAHDVENYLRTDGMTFAPRSWFISPDKTQELKLDISRVEDEGERPAAGGLRAPRAAASAMLGLSPEEDVLSGVGQRYLRHGQWFDRSMRDWPFVCIVPSAMMGSLRLEGQDVGGAYVSTLGRRLRVVGVLDSHGLNSYTDLDDEELMPVDFVEQQMKEGVAAEEDTGGALTATGEKTAAHVIAAEGGEQEALYVHMHPERVLVIPNELCLKLGGSLRAIAASAAAGQDEILKRSFMNWLRAFAKRFRIALYAGVDGYVTRMATRGQLSMSGAQGLVVPILIAALIVFNTMLGAVYERMTEIKIYASVGLAPIHIGALFFAESCVFAVVGAMMGYLLGQMVSFGLTRVPSLLEGISLNYSSISAVWSALLVMVVVLASTAYPARMAGKLSVPDETRKMPIPKPTSDVWHIRFPFTVSSNEALGVMAYLRQYFVSNDEDSVGAFTADSVKFFTEEPSEGEPLETDVSVGVGTRLCLRADVWVAPLDMGISQGVKIVCAPDAEEPAITYLFFTIVRRSGEFATWHRMNMGFLKDLRKQLLIWRLVILEEKQRLAREGAALLEGRPETGV